MAQRPVFVPGKRIACADAHMTDFIWNKGLSVSQKKKNVTALHDAFLAAFPGKKVLEISTKSSENTGVQLSAFNLMLYVPSLDERISVECAYQGSKVFAKGGPYTDLYAAGSRKAKKDPRLHESGALLGYRYEGVDYPCHPAPVFYDWLYIQALIQNPELSSILMEYDGFTDIEFNPNRGKSCQAHSAALYVSLVKLGLLDRCGSFETFYATVAPHLAE